MKILGIGEIVWDCLPGGRKLGGAPVNFCFYAKELGAEVFPVSAVGDDELGMETLSSCISFGLPVKYIQVNPLPTSRVLVSVDSDGVPQYEIVENVAWDSLDVNEECLALASDADCICWGSLAQRSIESREAILKILDSAPANCLKVFDINIRQHYYSKEVIESSLKRSHILKLNEDELPLVLEVTGCSDVSELINNYDLKYVIFTCGAAFSEVFSADGLLSHLETPKVNVADTVGAGDSFTAAFVTCLLKGMKLEKCHQIAVDISASVCTKPGAINHITL